MRIAKTMLASAAALGLTAAPTLIDSAKNPVDIESVTSQAGVTTYRSARPNFAFRM